MNIVDNSLINPVDLNLVTFKLKELDDKIICKIFKNFSFQEIIACRRVNKDWQGAIDQSSLWWKRFKNICLKFNLKKPITHQYMKLFSSDSKLTPIEVIDYIDNRLFVLCKNEKLCLLDTVKNKISHIIDIETDPNSIKIDNNQVVLQKGHQLYCYKFNNFIDKIDIKPIYDLIISVNNNNNVEPYKNAFCLWKDSLIFVGKNRQVSIYDPKSKLHTELFQYDNFERFSKIQINDDTLQILVTTEISCFPFFEFSQYNYDLVDKSLKKDDEIEPEKKLWVCHDYNYISTGQSKIKFEKTVDGTGMVSTGKSYKTREITNHIAIAKFSGGGEKQKFDYDLNEEFLKTKKIEEHGSYFLTSGVTIPNTLYQFLSSNVIWIKDGDKLRKANELDSKWKGSELINGMYILLQNNEFQVLDLTKSPFVHSLKDRSTCTIQ